MTLKFIKYQGTGNDFVILDAIKQPEYASLMKQQVVRHLCDRRFGIGADGLIVLAPHDQYDFRMIYYNADGRVSTMCGNGGRCVLHYYYHNIRASEEILFLAIDGPHTGIVGNEVQLKMNDVPCVDKNGADYILDTGSPHYVQFAEKINDIDVNALGRMIRHSPPFKADGINVNFVRLNDKSISVRTYERGVENETLSCGTGVVASAIASSLKRDVRPRVVLVDTPGGSLEVSFTPEGDGFTDIWLKGPAKEVFRGKIDI